jgi:hypothetical protein
MILSPTDTDLILKAAWVFCELTSCAIFVWWYSKRYTARGFFQRIRCHL